MPDRFTGTMLTKINTQGGLPEDPAKAFGKMSEETDKALLDILKKVNELAGTSADASATGSTLSGLGGALSSAIKGMKYGLDVIYVSSDTLSILPGAVEVNGELVVCPNALAITSSMANFPAAGSWAFVTMERGGVPRLFPATGTASQRPTNNFFQWSGGGVGFLDLGKQGYYYDTARRIIGAIHKISSTSWYFVGLGAGIIESGNNANGYYRKFSDRTMEQWGTAGHAIGSISNNNIGTYGLSLYYGSATVAYPTAFFAAPIVTVTAGAYGISSTAYTIGTTTFVTATYSTSTATAEQNIVCWHAIGRWRA